MRRAQLRELIRNSIRKHGRNPAVLEDDLYGRLQHLCREPKPPRQPMYVNSYVTDKGRTYRICRHYGGRPILIALKSAKPKGRERLIDLNGRRAGELVRLQEQGK